MANEFENPKMKNIDEIPFIQTKGTEIFEMWKFSQSKKSLIFLIILHVIAGIIPFLFYIFLGEYSSIGSIKPNEIWNNAKSTSLKMFYAILASIIVENVMYFTRSKVLSSFSNDIKIAIFERIIKQPIEFFDRTPTGILMSRMTEDVAIVSRTYIENAFNIVQFFTQIITSIIVLFYTSWIIALISIAFLPFLFLVYFCSGRIIGFLFMKYQECITIASCKAEECITQFRTVKAFNCEEKEQNQYNSILQNMENVNSKIAFSCGIREGIIKFISIGSFSLIFYVSCYFIMKKPQYHIKIDALTTTFMSLMMCGIAIDQLINNLNFFRKANICARKLLILLELPIINNDEGQVMNDFKGKIEFKNVSFHYPTSNEMVLNKLSFTINPGETVAIVGESGCGKTTILQLIQHFYDVSEGEILINNVNIKDISNSFLRSKISTVPQIPVLFSMSIADNIKYGKNNSSEEEIIRASEIADAKGFIISLNNGYEQNVSQCALSGGQKQRICIARALIMNSEIMLLDEATSSLDAESEMLIQKALESNRKGKTTIIVAHRLSTVKNADRIVVLSKGQIAESGTHDELLEKDGIYANIIKNQLQ